MKTVNYMWSSEIETRKPIRPFSYRRARNARHLPRFREAVMTGVQVLALLVSFWLFLIALVVIGC